MSNTSYFAAAIVAGTLMSTTSAFGATILFEDFEDSTVTYSSSAADDLTEIAARDYYGVTSQADLPSAVSYSNIQGTGFYALEDTDGAANPVDDIVLSYTGIDVSNFINLNLSFFLAEDDEGSNEDWDNDTSFSIDVQLDGGGFFTAFAVEAEGIGGFFNKAPKVDTDFDGFGDGTEITDAFAQFNFDIANGGLLDLQLTFTGLTAQDEDLALDNILLSGDTAPVAAVPLPAGFWLLGMALGGLGLARRKA